jgi:hypothetical protein
MCAARLAAHVPDVPTRPLAIAATVWCGVAAVLLVAGLWLLLAGSLNAHRRDGKPLSGVALAGRITLVAAGWPLVLLGCTAGSVRTRLRCSTRRLVAAGRDAAVTTDHETHHHLERTVQAMNRPPRGHVDHGVPQTAPFRVGQRIRNTHAGRGVVIAVQARDVADPRGRAPGGRWWEIVVEFDQPYMPLARAGRAWAVRTWTWNVLADRYGQSRAAATSPRHSPDDWPCAAAAADGRR